MLKSLSDQVRVANQANVDTLLTVTNAAINSLEHLTELSLTTARTLVSGTAAHAKVAPATKPLPPTELFQPVFDSSLSYAVTAIEIAAQTREALLQTMQRRQAE